MDIPFSNELDLLSKLTDYLDLGTRDTELSQEEQELFEALGADIAERFGITNESVTTTFHSVLEQHGISEESFSAIPAEDKSSYFQEIFHDLIERIKEEFPNFGIEINHDEELVARYQAAYNEIAISELPEKLDVVDAEISKLAEQLQEATMYCDNLDPSIHPVDPEMMSREDQEALFLQSQIRVEELSGQYDAKIEERTKYEQQSELATSLAIHSDKPTAERLEELRSHAKEFGLDQKAIEGESWVDPTTDPIETTNDPVSSIVEKETPDESDQDDKLHDMMEGFFEGHGQPKYEELSKAYNGNTDKMSDTVEYLKKWQSGATNSHVDSLEAAMKSKIEYDLSKEKLEHLSQRTKFRNTFTVAERLAVDVAAYKTGLPGASGKAVCGGDIALGVLELSRTNIFESALEMVVYSIFEKIAPAERPETDVTKDDSNQQVDNKQSVNVDQHGDRFCGVDFGNTDSKYARNYNNDYVTRNVYSYQNLGTDLKGEKTVRVCDMRVITYKGNSYAVDPFGKATAIDIGNEKYLIPGTDTGFVTVEKWDSLKGERLEAAVANVNSGVVKGMSGGTVDEIKSAISDIAFDRFYSKVGRVVDTHISSISSRIEAIESIEHKIKDLESAKKFYEAEAAIEADDKKKSDIESKIDEIDSLKQKFESILEGVSAKTELEQRKVDLESAKDRIFSPSTKTDADKYEKMQALVSAEKIGYGVSKTESIEPQKEDVDRYNAISTDFKKGLDEKIENLRGYVDTKVERVEILRDSAAGEKAFTTDKDKLEQIDTQVEKYDKALASYEEIKSDLGALQTATTEEKAEAIMQISDRITNADALTDAATKDDVSDKIEAVKDDLVAIKEKLTESNDGSPATDAAIERISVAESVVDSNLGTSQKIGALERALDAAANTDTLTRDDLHPVGAMLEEAETLDSDSRAVLSVEDIKDMLTKAFDQKPDGTFSMSDYIKDSPHKIDPDRFAEACKAAIKEKIENSKESQDGLIDEEMQERIADVVSDCIDTFTQLSDDPIVAQDMACEYLETIFSSDDDIPVQDILQKVIDNRELEITERPSLLDAMEYSVNDLEAKFESMEDPMAREQIKDMLTDTFEQMRDILDIQNPDDAESQVDFGIDSEDSYPEDNYDMEPDIDDFSYDDLDPEVFFE